MSYNYVSLLLFWNPCTLCYTAFITIATLLQLKCIHHMCFPYYSYVTTAGCHIIVDTISLMSSICVPVHIRHWNNNKIPTRKVPVHYLCKNTDFLFFPLVLFSSRTQILLLWNTKRYFFILWLYCYYLCPSYKLSLQDNVINENYCFTVAFFSCKSCVKIKR